MEFVFIDNSKSLDRHSQRLVRSRVMKGKNLGKVIPERGHRRRQCEDEIHCSLERTEPRRSAISEKGRPLLPKGSLPDPGAASASAAPIASPVDHFCGAEYSYFATPVPVTSSSRQLFHELHYAVSEELYPRTFCRQSNEIATSWFETVLANPCVFHCGLAMMGLHRSQLLGYRDEPPETTRHLLQAIRLLRRELGTVSETRDSSVAVAVSLAVRANVVGAAAESRMHLHALKRMIELRPGGLAALCAGVPELGNKMRRADLELALRAGTPTIFGSRSLALPAPLCVVPLGGRKPAAALPHPLGEACAELQSAARDVVALCSYAGSEQLGAFQYQDLVISIVQRLIDYAPLGGARPPSPLDDICQLGLLSFMSTIINHGRQRRLVYSRLLSGIFRMRLDVFYDSTVWKGTDKCSELHLWLVFIYAASAPDYERCCGADSPTAARIRALNHALALKTWDDAAARLRVYPWIEAFHDEPCKNLWEAATCR